MTGKLAAYAWLFAVAGTVAVNAGAQIQTVDTSQPIVVKSSKPENNKHAKFIGEFVSSTPSSITVRDPKNTYSVRTFSDTPEARATMFRIAARGGYHYGDKIEIEYAIGTDVALKIKGKPSSSAVR